MLLWIELTTLKRSYVLIKRRRKKKEQKIEFNFSSPPLAFNLSLSLVCMLQHYVLFYALHIIIIKYANKDNKAERATSYAAACQTSSLLSSVLRIAWIEEDVKYDERETGGGTCSRGRQLKVKRVLIENFSFIELIMQARVSPFAVLNWWPWNAVKQ